MPDNVLGAEDVTVNKTKSLFLWSLDLNAGKSANKVRSAKSWTGKKSRVEYHFSSAARPLLIGRSSHATGRERGSEPRRYGVAQWIEQEGVWLSAFFSSEEIDLGLTKVSAHTHLVRVVLHTKYLGLEPIFQNF